MFGIGWSEIVLILILSLILLGPERIPQVFTTFGKLLRELRTTRDELQEEFRKALAETPSREKSLTSSLTEDHTFSSELPSHQNPSPQEPSLKGFGAPVRFKRTS